MWPLALLVCLRTPGEWAEWVVGIFLEAIFIPGQPEVTSLYMAVTENHIHTLCCYAQTNASAAPLLISPTPQRSRLLQHYPRGKESEIRVGKEISLTDHKDLVKILCFLQILPDVKCCAVHESALGGAIHIMGITEVHIYYHNFLARGIKMSHSNRLRVVWRILTEGNSLEEGRMCVLHLHKGSVWDSDSPGLEVLSVFGLLKPCQCGREWSWFHLMV